jgi:protein TonB
MQAVKNLSLGGSGRALFVIGLHVVVIYLVATSLGVIKNPLATEPMEATLIEPPQESTPIQPSVVKPELVEPTLDVPEPDTVPIPEIEVPSDVPSSAAITASTSNAVESTELQVANRVAPVYPSASLRASEEGAVIFRVLVDERGKPLQVDVMKSSGFSRLDEAAKRAVGHWTFVPPKKDGQPVRSWSRVQVRFELKNT